MEPFYGNFLKFSRLFSGKIPETRTVKVNAAKYIEMLVLEISAMKTVKKRGKKITCLKR